MLKKVARTGAMLVDNSRFIHKKKPAEAGFFANCSA